MTKRKRETIQPGERRGRRGTSLQEEATAQWGDPSEWAEEEVIDPARVAELESEKEQLQIQLKEMSQISEAVEAGNIIYLGRCQLTPIGLVMPEDLNPEELAEIGHQLSRLDGSLQWMIGDWVAFNENRQYGDMPAIAEMFDRSEKTLRNYASVSRKFSELSRRRENLSFAHHEVVAALANEEADYWLNLAEEQAWTREKLRRVIQQANDEQAADLKANVLADKTNRVRFNRVWRNVQTDNWEKLKLEDVRWLQGWLRQIEDRLTEAN